MRLRGAVMIVAMLLVVAACGGGAEPTTTVVSPETIPEHDSAALQPAPGTTQDRSSVTTSTPATSTTSTTSDPEDRVFVVIAAGSGTFRNEASLGPVYGDVRPEAVVTVDGVRADVSYVGDTVFGDGVWRWSLEDAVVLEEGSNSLVFEATFPDGSALNQTRTYHYVPSLERSTGYVVGLTLAIPPRITLEFAALEYGEFGLEQAGGDTEIAEIPVAADAAFVVLGTLAEDQVMSLRTFAELAAIAAGETSLDDRWWKTIFPKTDEGGHSTAAPWEFLLTSDGQLQQAAQMYSP